MAVESMRHEQHARVHESDAPEPLKAAPRVVTYASIAVQLGAAALLGGGFYYGIARQQRVEKEEEAKAAKKRTKKKKNGQVLSQAAKDKVPVIRETTLLERQLGLHRPVPPNVAALRSLIGGTIVSVSGCAVLLAGLAAVLGVRSVTEFRERMEDVFPRMRNNVSRAFNIQPKQPPTAHELALQEAELQELAALFSEPLEPKVVDSPLQLELMEAPLELELVDESLQLQANLESMRTRSSASDGKNSSSSV